MTARMIRRALVLVLVVASLHTLRAQVTFDRILKAKQEPQNWLTYSGGVYSQRHSELTQITPENVKNLELSWMYQLQSREPTTTRFENTRPIPPGMESITCWKTTMQKSTWRRSTNSSRPRPAHR